MKVSDRYNNNRLIKNAQWGLYRVVQSYIVTYASGLEHLAPFGLPIDPISS